MKQLLIVVDMQNDFVSGALGSEEAKAIVPKVGEKVAAALGQGWDVVFTKDTHGEDYLSTQEGRNLPVPHCIKGTEGWEIIPELAAYSDHCPTVEKPTFGSMELAKMASAGSYDRIQLVGLCTDICVISNAMILKAALPETPISVDSTCCAGVTPESHRNALEAMKLCQIQVED